MICSYLDRTIAEKAPRDANGRAAIMKGGRVSRRIFYFCDNRHIYTFGIFAAFYAREIAPALRLVPYQALGRIRTFPAGAYIFTDFDRLETGELGRLAQLVDDFEGRGRLVLNHPSRSLGRFDLLRALHTQGLNVFNVYRLAEWHLAKRFPVFIRAEKGHRRPFTGLLPDASALQREAEALWNRGDAVSDLMIVEFGNARGVDGKFRKYSAYRVGNEIYGQHCFANRHWWIKYSGNDFGETGREEHLRYVAENPHRAQLERIFELASIEYGRIDYCVVNGAVQTFEINTNPTVLQVTSARRGDMSPYARLHEDALTALLERVPDTGPLINPMFKGGPVAIADRVGVNVIEYVKKKWPQAAPSAPIPSE